MTPSSLNRSSPEQISKAQAFAALHVAGQPLLLYNVWDAGSAKAVADAGAKALASGSWSVAVAQGFKDGQDLPLSWVEQFARQMVAAVNLPVSIDFEGAYATTPEATANNAALVMNAGAVGINFEDQIVGGVGLYAVADQCKRIAAIRKKADDCGLPFFINARTDLFLKAPSNSDHAALLVQAKLRAQAFQEAGASGFFAPGLMDETLIESLCASSKLPVNVMVRPGVPSNARLAELGVARVSYGPGSYRALMEVLQASARAVFEAQR
jgi:2-methylisocitrate lyase-like PEP mutase family enzyme